MSKTLLLTKSNLKKNRGTSAGLFLLMTIAACLIGISLLVFFDAYPVAEREAARLNAGDGYLSVTGNVDGITDEKIEEIIEEDTESYYIYRNLAYSNNPIPFGNGEVVITSQFSDSSAFEMPMNTCEVVKEDSSVTEDYIYLPYQFNTAGGFETGDTFEVDLGGTKHSYTVKGFLNVAYGGCNNNALYSFVLDDDSYDELAEEGADENIMVIFDLKDDVTVGAFLISTSTEILTLNPMAVVSGYDLPQVLGSRTFMALIIAVSFLVLTLLIVAAVAMMLANCISNYIKENMKTLGALKAIGYTGGDIKGSLVVWFLIIAAVASAVGIVLAYLLMPVFAGIIVGQMGIPYAVSFNMLATVIPAGFVLIFTLLVTLIASAKVTKILPIVALREGFESHNFRKNHAALSSTPLSLNMGLAVKTFFGNIKQNVITFFVIGLMVFSCVVSLLMYENFSRHPKLELLATEICAGVVTSDVDSKEEIRSYLEDRSDIKNVREIISINFYYNEEAILYTYVVEDPAKMNNQNVCYKGRLPQYDNEIAISGAFARDYGFEIGDEIEMDYGDNSYTYLVTGYIQTLNNAGREALVTYDGANHIVETEMIPGWFWFDLTDESDDNKVNEEEVERIIDECKDKYDGHILSTMNFFEIMNGSMTTFQSISTMMLVIMCTVSVVVIGLILYLLIKSLIYHKRKDYGIYKALGYTSGSLMLQTALSFMPSVIASVSIFSVVWYYLANPYMSTFMGMFGLVKCTFDIPISGVVMIAIGFAVISFLLALVQTRRIKKIEAYNMLVAE